MLKVPEEDENQTSKQQQQQKTVGVLELTGETFDEQTTDGITFVDFFAPWYVKFNFYLPLFFCVNLILKADFLYLDKPRESLYLESKN